MVEPDADTQVWRIPSYQPALLMLVLVAAAALNIYAHPSATVRIPTLVIGLACGGLSLVALRLQMVATADGLSVRELRTEHWIAWPDLETVEVVNNVRGAPSLRLNLRSGAYVDVPPSLLQPTKPTSKRAVMAQLGVAANELEDRRRRYRPAS